MKTVTVTRDEAARRRAPQMAGKKVIVLEIVPGNPHLITYRVEWPCKGGWTTITRIKERSFVERIQGWWR